MADFRIVYDGTTGKIEGEYADLPGDSGGRTWKGISENNNPEWHGWDFIDALLEAKPYLAETSRRDDLNRKLRAHVLLEHATYERLKSKYWDVFWGDRIQSQPVAEELYDQTVHFGDEPSIKHLQRVLNVLNRRGDTYPDLLVDADYGTLTHGALAEACRVNSDRPIVLYLNCLQGARYVMLAEQSKNSKYEGWLWGFAKRLEV